jgi:hypothetical protein
MIVKLHSVLMRKGGIQITSAGSWHAGDKKGLHVDATQGNEGVASNHPHILRCSVAERGIIPLQAFTIFALLLTLISNGYVG